MADVPWLNHPQDGYKGFPDDVQTKLHVKPSLMGDRVVLDGRSTCDERTHDRNTRKPVWHVCEPVWRLERPFLNHDVHDERANRRTEHGYRPTYQTEHFKHIPVVVHMKIKSRIIRTRSLQLPGLQAGLLLHVKFYMVGAQASLPGSPVSQESEE